MRSIVDTGVLVPVPIYYNIFFYFLIFSLSYIYPGAHSRSTYAYLLSFFVFNYPFIFVLFS
ncbi:hypothetical protein DFH27DRAFT_572731 [Peziza echinospora]|nr:hypothetical protein DFH27DRAFT_572731 [Peziza echinospora]